MYITSVTLFMLVLPVLSIVIESAMGGQAISLALAGKWFVFWAIGIRLLTAGVRQAAKPGLTAEGILGVKDKASWIVVRELGFANISIGLAGIISLWQAGWRPAAAFVGGLFLLLDGILHTQSKKRNFEENVAMYSDLAIGIVMAVYLVSLL
ncbi:MAG: hypothetical protein Q7T74_00685 [Candidatus Saccharibacteria bacterium]|nr:hypothetical protein [Candidatus Saccharibacteria bacterium]